MGENSTHFHSKSLFRVRGKCLLRYFTMNPHSPPFLSPIALQLPFSLSPLSFYLPYISFFSPSFSLILFPFSIPISLSTPSLPVVLSVKHQCQTSLLYRLVGIYLFFSLPLSSMTDYTPPSPHSPRGEIPITLNHSNSLRCAYKLNNYTRTVTCTFA